MEGVHGCPRGELGIEESIKTVREKVCDDEEREGANELLRQAFEKTGQSEGLKYLSG